LITHHLLAITAGQGEKKQNMLLSRTAHPLATTAGRELI
jgi:hypothetical protein